MKEHRDNITDPLRFAEDQFAVRRALGNGYDPDAFNFWDEDYTLPRIWADGKTSAETEDPNYLKVVIGEIPPERLRELAPRGIPRLGRE